jgi:hypothetical protein
MVRVADACPGDLPEVRAELAAAVVPEPAAKPVPDPAAKPAEVPEPELAAKPVVPPKKVLDVKAYTSARAVYTKLNNLVAQAQASTTRSNTPKQNTTQHKYNQQLNILHSKYNKTKK